MRFSFFFQNSKKCLTGARQSEVIPLMNPNPDSERILAQHSKIHYSLIFTQSNSFFRSCSRPNETCFSLLVQELHVVALPNAFVEFFETSVSNSTKTEGIEYSNGIYEPTKDNSLGKHLNSLLQPTRYCNQPQLRRNCLSKERRLSRIVRSPKQ